MTPEPVSSFFRFALAFESAFAENDWSALAPHLADEVVWVVDGLPATAGGLSQGRAPCLSAIAASCGTFDYRFDRREPKILEGPTPIPGGVHLTWTVTYTREGLEPFELRGEEWDLFGDDGALELHRERIHNLGDSLAFLERHSAALRPQR